MQLDLQPRQPGDVPIGALLMTPLFALPLGAWLVQNNWLVFGECGVKMVVGLPCFTCGATRATIHLLEGHLLSALAFQPLVVVGYLLFAVWGTASLTSFAADLSIDVSLSSTEDTIAKILVVSLPLLNWAYLVAAGV